MILVTSVNVFHNEELLQSIKDNAFNNDIPKLLKSNKDLEEFRNLVSELALEPLSNIDFHTIEGNTPEVLALMLKASLNDQ